MDTTLCLVDAQVGFWQNAGKIEKQLIHTLESSLRRKDKLVVLEHTIRNFYKTHPSLMQVIKCFPKEDVQFVEKLQDDGAEEVAYTINQREFPTNVRICGVNRCCCVYNTATTLAGYRDGITVELMSNSVSCWDYCSCENKSSGLTSILEGYKSNGVRIN